MTPARDNRARFSLNNGLRTIIEQLGTCYGGKVPWRIYIVLNDLIRALIVALTKYESLVLGAEAGIQLRQGE